MVERTLVSTGRSDARVRDLERLIGELQTLHDELLEVAQRKLLAMRRSDLDSIQRCAVREGELTASIREREGLRRRLMILIGQDFGMDETAALKLSVSSLIDRLDPTSRVRLKARRDQLAAVLAQLAKVNGHVMGFAKAMLDHYRAVFAMLTTSRVERPVYARSGVPVQAAAHVVDTTG